MTAKFDGFSQDEINKINSKPKKIGLFDAKSIRVGRGIRRIPDKPISSAATSLQNDKNIMNKNNRNSENGVKVAVKSSSLSATTTTTNNLNDNKEQIDYNRKISDESLTKLHDAVHFQTLQMKMQQNELKTHDETDYSDESILHLSNFENNKNMKKMNENNLQSNGNLDKYESNEEQLQMSPFRGISLKDFEAQRKIREEQNKIKKDILYKAIEKHTQKTVAEVKKIEDIKSELSKLDHDLATDVAILRKQIETACIHYTNIEKHYNKVEQMFLKAKLDLHQASEKKELLTEHLCTVITHNEDRKAKKLSELMEKVGLSPTTGEDQIIQPVIADVNSHTFENNNELIEK